MNLKKVWNNKSKFNQKTQKRIKNKKMTEVRKRPPLNFFSPAYAVKIAYSKPAVGRWVS